MKSGAGSFIISFIDVVVVVAAFGTEGDGNDSTADDFDETNNTPTLTQRYLRVQRQEIDQDCASMLLNNSIVMKKEKNRKGTGRIDVPVESFGLHLA